MSEATKHGDHGLSPAPHHALIIPMVAQGHINPMMHLALRLARDHGFVITFVVTDESSERIRSRLAAVADQNGEQELDIRLAHIVDRRESRSINDFAEIRDFCFSFKSLVVELKRLVDSLLLLPPHNASVAANDPPPISLVITDLFLQFTLDIVAKSGVPGVAFWPMSAGNLATIMAIHQGHRPNADDPTELVRWIPGVPPLKPTEINNFLRCYDPADPIFTDTYMKPYERFASDAKPLLIMNTFEELEHEALEALRAVNPNVFAVGPVLPRACFGGEEDERFSCSGGSAFWEEDHRCLEWLDQQESGSVLYVSFGSLAVLTAEQFEELATGIERSGCPLLWVMRRDLVSTRDARERDKGELPFSVGFVERLEAEGRGCFVEWAPQLAVLAHRAVAGFLTHCGWNSVLEGIATGVPMLGWPYFADQMQNKRCCVDAWGIGLAFDSDPSLGQLVPRDEVEAKVRELMALGKHGASTPFHRQRASFWRDSARESVLADLGSSRMQWTELVAALARIRS